MAADSLLLYVPSQCSSPLLRKQSKGALSQSACEAGSVTRLQASLGMYPGPGTGQWSTLVLPHGPRGSLRDMGAGHRHTHAAVSGVPGTAGRVKVPGSRGGVTGFVSVTSLWFPVGRDAGGVWWSKTSLRLLEAGGTWPGGGGGEKMGWSQ